MTWLLLIFGMAGPAIVGEFATEDDCDMAATEFMAVLHNEHKEDGKFHAPPIACVGIPDAFPGPADGKRI